MRRKLGRSTNLVRPGPPPLPGGAVVFEHAFSANMAAKNETREALIGALESAGAVSGEAELARCRLCLDEALTNAVMHGSQNAPEKIVRVRVFLEKTRWSVLVEDQGAGFREEDLPDPHAEENLLEESGRGIHLIRSFMDDVSFWNGGAAVLMAKAIKAKRHGQE